MKSFQSISLKSRKLNFLLDINDKILRKMQKHFDNKVFPIKTEGLESIDHNNQEILNILYNSLKEGIIEFNSNLYLDQVIIIL